MSAEADDWATRRDAYRRLRAAQEQIAAEQRDLLRETVLFLRNSGVERDVDPDLMTRLRAAVLR